MARFRKYSDSNDKNGYFLYHFYEGKNITYQIKGVAEELLLEHGYKKGDRLDEDIFYALLETGLIYTNNSGPGPNNNINDLPDLEGEENTLSKDERKKLFDRLMEHSKSQKVKEKLREYIQSQFEDIVGSGRDERYEEYWELVNRTRFLRKLVDEKDIYMEREIGVSELVDEYIGVLEQKNQMREKRKKEGWGSTLPKYTDKFGEPKWEHYEINESNSSKFGLSPSSFDDSEDPIYLKKDYYDSIESKYSK